MKLKVILKPAPVADDQNLRPRLLEYGIDFTDLIMLAVQSYDAEDNDPYIWEYHPLLSMLDPRHKVHRMFEKGRLSTSEYVRINSWLCDAVLPLCQELRRFLEPIVQSRFLDDRAVSYCFKGYLHRCDGLVIEITPRIR